MADVPPPPGGWSPPDDVVDTTGGFSWWAEWEELSSEEAGASTLYDPANDRLFIEPRPGVFHDEMIRGVIEQSPFPKFPDEASTGAAMHAGSAGWQADIPTIAEGAQAAVARLGDKTLRTRASETPVGWVYKHVAGMYMVDIPGETKVTVGYRGRGGVGGTERVPLQALYRELAFENKLPQKKVDYDRDSS